MIRGEGLYKLYQTGGEKFLAYRLETLLRPVITEQDRVLHNDVLVEMLDLLNTGYADKGKITKQENELLAWISCRLLRKRKKKRFLLGLAKRILLIGQTKKG
ncbi:hypothetical protein LCGC14_1092990 [marine sediment metagenome]|uniref:Uncharacterized protein n=1 Tax=marine sediment metagenome TaxID=412755 RepID=A0A0F9PUY2_9ZZZZ